MNNLSYAVNVVLPDLLEKLRDKMQNAKTRQEYLEAETLYLFLTESNRLDGLI